MDATITHQHFQIKKNVPELRAGDRVRVHQKIREGSKERIQVFEGLIIKTQHGVGINGTFTVRRISLGVGIEKTFPLHLPSIVKVEKLKSAKVRRAKLYYVRGLVGKAARRLKKEKEDAAVWEDVVEEAPADETLSEVEGSENPSEIEESRAEVPSKGGAETAEEEQPEASDQPSEKTEREAEKPEDKEKSPEEKPEAAEKAEEDSKEKDQK